MARRLVVARLREPDWLAGIESHLRELGIAASSDSWNRDVQAQTLIVPSMRDVLQLRDAALELEGLGLESMSLQSPFASLPILPRWIWIPIELPAPKIPLYPAKIGPVGLASCHGLLRALDLLLPALGVGGASPGATVEVESVRAVWQALHRGARLSIAGRTPLIGFLADEDS